MEDEDKTCVNPIEDQRQDALRHYDEVSAKANYWSSFVRDAILAYNPQPSEQKPTEKNVSGAEEIWNKVIYTQHLESGDEAYIIEKEDFIKAMQEYAQQSGKAERLKAIDEALNLPKKRIANGDWDRIEYISVKDLEKLKNNP